MVYDVLRKALIALGIDPKSMDYHNGSGLVGSHSIQKLAATWVRMNGTCRENKDYHRQ